MTKQPLYQDADFKVDYSADSREECLLWISEKAGEGRSYTLRTAFLSELARAPRGGIEVQIAAVDDRILSHLKQEGLGVDGLHVVLCQAYEKLHQNHLERLSACPPGE